MRGRSNGGDGRRALSKRWMISTGFVLFRVVQTMDSHFDRVDLEVRREEKITERIFTSRWSRRGGTILFELVSQRCSPMLFQRSLYSHSVDTLYQSETGQNRETVSRSNDR